MLKTKISFYTKVEYNCGEYSNVNTSLKTHILFVPTKKRRSEYDRGRYHIYVRSTAADPLFRNPRVSMVSGGGRWWVVGGGWWLRLGCSGWVVEGVVGGGGVLLLVVVGCWW